MSDEAKALKDLPNALATVKAAEEEEERSLNAMIEARKAHEVATSATIKARMRLARLFQIISLDAAYIAGTSDLKDEPES